jgi:hypothetical protein
LVEEVRVEDERRMPIIVVEVPGVGEYKGEVNEKGEFHGRGAMTFTAGGFYDGDWQHNKREGMGTFSYSDGSAYTGMYRNGKKEGFGDQTYAEGDRYQGDWSSGFRNGWGRMQYSQTDTQYEGQWKDDRKNGIGILTYVAKINTWSLEVWENDILLCSRKFDKTGGPDLLLFLSTFSSSTLPLSFCHSFLTLLFISSLNRRFHLFSSDVERHRSWKCTKVQGCNRNRGMDTRRFI